MEYKNTRGFNSEDHVLDKYQPRSRSSDTFIGLHFGPLFCPVLFNRRASPFYHIRVERKNTMISQPMSDVDNTQEFS